MSGLLIVLRFHDTMLLPCGENEVWYGTAPGVELVRITTLKGVATYNLTLTVLITTLMLILADWGHPFAFPSHHSPSRIPLQQVIVSWDPPTATVNIVPGSTSLTSTRIRNSGNQEETFTLVVDRSRIPADWDVSLTPSLTTLLLTPGMEQAFLVAVTVPSSAAAGSYSIGVQAQGFGGTAPTFLLLVNVVPATPTNTPIPTDTPTPTVTPTVPPSSVQLTVSPSSAQGVLPGGSVKYQLSIRNPGPGRGTFRIIANYQSCSKDVPGCTESATATSLDIPAGETRSLDVTVTMPANAEKGRVGKTTVRVELEGNPSVYGEVILSTTVLEATATPVPTATPASTPTRTPTPTPLSRICKDIYENDNERDRAVVIDVNVPQPNPNRHADDRTDDRRAICPPGDEDWIRFAGVGGKVYTIDIDQMADGIDLSLELFDQHGRRLAFNDDFFKREAQKDWIMPRIESWTAPTDGTYFVRIRDAAGRGGLDRTYRVRVLTESYGPTPVQVNEECMDLFEPDGLPEQAKLMLSNERQSDRKICPSGDADWITFFGKKGKRYFIYTDTTPYGKKEVNKAQTGADTILVLTDRDGVSIIDYNDDIAGGETLDSQIEFIPEVDGFYYVQVKNVGDIGNQFIRYDLVLELCRPGQTDCGRPSSASTSQAKSSSTVGSLVPATPVPALALNLSATPFVLGAAEGLSNSPPPGFANGAFWEIWRRSEQPVAERRVVRSWIWGPRAFASTYEPLAEANGGQRLVQYFDKGRMEWNDPTGDQLDHWFVTFGLLAQEMVTNQIQVGNDQFLFSAPADIPIIGDLDDPHTPTYSSFHALIGQRFPDLTGEHPFQTIDRQGTIGSYQGPTYAEAILAAFIPETGHNIPAAFWQFFHMQGEIYQHNQYRIGPLFDWAAVIGYPITEPYWVRASFDQTPQEVLVQIFQRRVLTYIPTAPAGNRVLMGDSGRHYYQWRYHQQASQ